MQFGCCVILPKGAERSSVSISRRLSTRPSLLVNYRPHRRHYTLDLEGVIDHWLGTAHGRTESDRLKSEATVDQVDGESPVV
jgi:hypothetical protein